MKKTIMKKIIGPVLAVALTISLSACGNSSGTTGTHIATTLVASAEVKINGSWAVGSASLLCDNASKATSSTSVYTFNSSSNSGTFVLNQPAAGYYPAMIKTVNFTIKTIDSSSFTIQTVGDMKCVYQSNNQNCNMGQDSSSLPISSMNPMTMNFQYAVSPSGSSLNLSVNDQTDVLTCGLGTNYSSSFLSIRQ
jgi:hypothetical protein